MSTTKKCGHAVPCGCGDKALTAPPPCNESGPCAGEPCAEVFCADCIANCNDQITVDTGPGSGIMIVAKGARWNTVLEQLMIISAGTPLANAPLNLKVKSKTSTSVTLTFTANSAISYDADVTDLDTTVVTSVTATHLGDGEFEVQITGLATNALDPTHEAVITGGAATSVTIQFNII